METKTVPVVVLNNSLTAAIKAGMFSIADADASDITFLNR
jgi:hypothetical protein